MLSPFELGVGKLAQPRLEEPGLADDQPLSHPAPWGFLHREKPVSSLDRGRGSAIEDCSGATRVGSDEARRGTEARFPGERAPHRVRLRLAADDEEDLSG